MLRQRIGIECLPLVWFIVVPLFNVVERSPTDPRSVYLEKL
jgi:hypothetical protein